MTGPIIPADQWPEGAVALMWNSAGVPLALHHGDAGDHEPWWVDWYSSRVPMPAGHDWRVPVMRPAAEALASGVVGEQPTKGEGVA